MARLIIISAAILSGIIAASLWNKPQPAPAGPARSAAQQAVPVGIAPVARMDMPIYLTGLGTVQASMTIAIHAQVEGQLQEVLFTEGQQVKKGDVLAKIDPRLFLAALNQAKAKKAQDTALMVAAEKDLARISELGQRNIASKQDVEQQQAKYAQLKAAISADDAAIETAQTQFDYTTIRAPSAGRVGIRLVDPGNLVRAADASAITTLVVTRPSAVMFTLPAGELDGIRAAMARGPAEVTAWDQDNQHVLSTGTLLLVDNAIDASTATIRLKAMFDNSDDRLWPGEFVNARVLVENRHGALAIPAQAVQRGPQGLFAWVVSREQTAEPRPIKVGPATNDQVIVTDGLEEGEAVVIEGQLKLQPNARVAAGPSEPPALRAGQ